MKTLEEKINECARIREFSAKCLESLLHQAEGKSERDCRDMLQKELLRDQSIGEQGWYDPPPRGTAFLFGSRPEYERLRFDTLRNKTFWPSESHTFNKETVALFYCSPFNRETGIIGDFGGTIYRGEDKAVRGHLKNVFDALMELAQYAGVGMEFRELHQHGQDIFQKRKLHNNRTVTYHDATGTNLGHTVPWSYEDPTEEEAGILHGASFEDIKNCISKKRLYLNKVERFKIPETIAFTVEARLESMEDPSLPNGFYHLIVAFKNGRKNILDNFNHSLLL